MTAQGGRPTKGSMRERRPGVWELGVGAGKDPVTGKYRTLWSTFEGTPRQAEKELAKIVRQVDAGEGIGTNGNVAWLLDLYLDHLAAKGTAPDTIRGYRSNITNHILPAIGDVPLGKLNAGHLDRLYSTLALTKHLSTSTIHQNHTIIRGALRRAKAWGYVAKNVAEDAAPPTVRRPEIEPPPVEVVRHLLARAAEVNGDLATFARLAATTGARRGEVGRLRWSHVDTMTGVAKIDATKTHQIRRLGLDPDTLAVVIHHQRAQRQRANDLEVTMVDDPYLFAQDAAGSTPRHVDHFTAAWIRLAHAEGHPTVRLNDLRHFVATQMIAEGVDVRTVAAHLGHGSGGAMTLKVYAHAIDTRQRAAVAVMGGLLSGAGITQAMAPGGGA